MSATVVKRLKLNRLNKYRSYKDDGVPMWEISVDERGQYKRVCGAVRPRSIHLSWQKLGRDSKLCW